MTETPCKCDTFEEMNLHKEKISVIVSVFDAVACQTCRAIIETDI